MPGSPTYYRRRSIRSLPFKPFDYQIRAAQIALRRFRGRGLLCDEVGLGKTIEAGIDSCQNRRAAVRSRCPAAALVTRSRAQYTETLRLRLLQLLRGLQRALDRL